VREEAAQLDLDPSTLFAPPSAAPRKQAARKRGKGVVADKYRHEDRAWSGRGKTPAWLSQLEAEGKNREQFRVDAGGNGEGSAG
jgi:DNA-binding protein H-NS